ncbi:hypothetical protein O6H91_23G065300 [Diphasiastrum complanatum]|uniref:Uncharacterized protein n=1 Tax=Diphasiastrum complanatum TaxID=34168 RepID=A0ACC2ABJ4_DIPCM|nr:hypothetical protein O6H91_Y453200 [Diphasiastrum complanatum]KAJ7514895.1 hypothetical protein O6H91_23G065300 [Diphasiastrum complanatum]
MRRALKEPITVEDFSGTWFLLQHVQWRLLQACKVMASSVCSKLASTPRDSLDNCSLTGRENQSVISDLEGGLLISRSSFAYFFLVAFEAGSVLRALCLLLVYPCACLSHHLFSEALGLQILIFVAVAGIKESTVQGSSRAVLIKFFLEDMHPQAYKVLIACGKRYVMTAIPRVIAEPFAKEYLGAEEVIGSELQVTSSGYCTGFVKGSCLQSGMQREKALYHVFGDRHPDIAVLDCCNNSSFMSSCKEAYVVPQSRRSVHPVPREQYLKPFVFHDGRLAVRPTPATALAVFLWGPIGLALALLRILVAISLPTIGLRLLVEAMLGISIRVKGRVPPPVKPGKMGVLFVCSHRTLLDPVFLSGAAKRRVPALTYSISPLSELLAPIKTVRLTRSRTQDSRAMISLLKQGDLAVCPEGTTCREPYLLRFSSLFAELADNIVPVAINCKIQIFHGSTARGWKAMDPFFFLMNPCPVYSLEFLDQLPAELSCVSGKSSYEVANYIQSQISQRLGFQCTNLTRKDKYRILAGNDGVAPEASVKPRRIISW